MEKVSHFKVDTERRWSLHGTARTKSGGYGAIGKYSDHLGIECKVRVTILAHTNEGNSPVINYGIEGGWARYHKISDERAPDVEKLIVDYNDVDLRQTALNLLKLDIDIAAFGISYKPKGISHKKFKQRRKCQVKSLEEIVKADNDKLRAEYVELNKLPDANAKIWKLRRSILGPKHKPQVPTCINHPNTGEIISDPEEIKRVTLEHNIKILTKNKARPEEKELNEEKLNTHNSIMALDNKDDNPLEYKTYEDKNTKRQKNV